MLSFHSLSFALALALLCGCASPYRLHQAILKGDSSKALKLVEKEKNIDKPSLAGETPLLLASFKGQTHVAAALLDRGAKVDAPNRVQQTPLMVASRDGQVECCRLLLDRGAQVNAADSIGHTALWLGAFNNQLEVVTLLLERGADVNSPADTNSTPLMAAGQVKQDTERQLALVRLLLDKGADAKTTRWNDRTALHAAAEGESVPVARLLVEHGADVNAKTDQARTPLHIAAFFEQKPMLEYLLSVGAKPAPNSQAPEATGKLYRFLAEHPSVTEVSPSESWRIAADHFDMAATNYTAVAKEAGKQVTKTFWMNLAAAAVAGAASGLTGAPVYYPTASSAPYSLQKKDFKKRAANCTRWAKECREKAAAK